MTNPDFRALCEELFVKLKEWDSSDPYHDCGPLLCRARAALAQPEPVAPTDEELLAMRSWSSHGPTFDSDLVDFGRRCYNLAKQPESLPYKLPEPVVPTDEELIRPIMWMLDDSIYDNDKGEIAQSLRELVARWEQLAITPIPAAERWPEFSDCDPQERVWAWNPVLDHWKLSRINRSVHTHWLPANALPAPEAP